MIVFVIIILALDIIPTVKADIANPMRQTAVKAFWFVIALQMIVLAELIYSRIFSFSEGHFENGFLVAAGFIALLSGLMLSDAAFAGGLIILFVCVGCDLVTAFLAFSRDISEGILRQQQRVSWSSTSLPIPSEGFQLCSTGSNFIWNRILFSQTVKDK